MNAQPSFDPPKHPPQRRRKSRVAGQPKSVQATPPTAPKAPRQRSRVKSNAVYAHRRQGLEAIAKLVTYSTLSLLGLVTLVNSIGYNVTQHHKLKHLETELQETKVRAEKVNRDFIRTFDPEAQKSVMEENSYKVAPDRLKIFLASPPTDGSASTTPITSNN